MPVLATTPGSQALGNGDSATAFSGGRRLTALLELAIAGAWLIVLIVQETGNAAALHHHALIEGGPPLLVAIPIFLLAWQVMVVAMMLPASLPTIQAFQGESPTRTRPRAAVATFLGANAIVWAIFGLLAFSADVVLHHVVDATPWLGARPWLIEAAVLAVAGGYQFAPLKRRSMAACRDPGDPGDLARTPSPTGRRAALLGLRHGLDCLGSSWALMLVMFAAGFASVWPMAALAALMTYEARGRHGQRVATAAGIVLLLAALIALSP